MPRLEKKLNAIAKKCIAYGCEFQYHTVGEVYRELTDSLGRTYIAKFIQLDVNGTAIVNGWEFIAALDYTKNGNIIRNISGEEIPERYRKAKPICEHCKTNRYRKYTFLVKNTETGELKQVGKGCLKDFTHGMSAEMAASYVSMFDTLIQGDAPWDGCGIKEYIPLQEYLAYVYETFRRFGWKNASDPDSTASRAYGYWEASHRIASDFCSEYLKDEMNQEEFNIESDRVRNFVKEAVTWASHLEDVSNYEHNLKMISNMEYITFKMRNLAASIIYAYEKEQKKRKAKEKRMTNERGSISKHQGKIGERLTISVKEAFCLSVWESPFGTTKLYKIIDIYGNDFIWKTTKGLSINFMENGGILIGTVKEHSEFNNVPQTVLTRCQYAEKEVV